MKKLVKDNLPQPILDLIRAVRNWSKRRAFAGLTTSDAFAKVYRENLWGGKSGEFNSGTGSSGDPAEKYVQYVSQFIVEKRVKTVVDLGCGDLRIGGRIACAADQYIGVDIVRDLIDHHRSHCRLPNATFLCLDMVRHDPPPGDLCLVRQVLQHLSNDEIGEFLGRIANYRYVLITEHFPKTDKRFIANKDKPHGPDTRITKHSAVVLAEPPYSLDNIEEVLVVPADLAGTTIRTFLVSRQSDSGQENKGPLEAHAP